jgi:outer membrane protein TolC
MKLKYWFITFLLSFSVLSSAQKSDSLILTFAEFLKTVKENHPVSKQSRLLIKSADAAITSAKGSFDPRLYYNLDQKQFDNKNYWTLQNGGIKISTPIGVDLYTGFEQTSGINLNNENQTPSNGLIYSQLSIPLLQGLLIDERRVALKQANLLLELSYVEQKNILNELILKATKSYWEWVQSYHNLQVMNEAVFLSNQRLQGIKQAALLGDNATIDTLEASIQFQDRSVNRQQQEIDFYSKTMMLSTFIWNEKTEPIQLSQNTVAPTKDDMSKFEITNLLLNELDSLIAIHPFIIAYQNKNSRLSLDLKLKQDKLKPLLNIKYNPLYEIANSNTNGAFTMNNYKWGVGFQFPLLLRKERGEIKIAKLKLTELNLELLYKKADLTNKISASFNEYAITQKQASQYNAIVENYFQLLVAEKKLFEIGESSVFMVNTRETNYINSKIKLNDLLYKYRKSGIDLLYNSGLLFNIE